MADPTCPVCATADIICGKWTILVIRDLAEGRSRFCELERSLAGISPRTLSLRLRALEEQGIVERHTFPEVPPRVEYSLTAKGEALVPLIEDMRRYGREWLGVRRLRGHARRRAPSPPSRPVGAAAHRARPVLATHHRGRNTRRRARNRGACATVPSTTRCGTSRWRPPRCSPTNPQGRRRGRVRRGRRGRRPRPGAVPLQAAHRRVHRRALAAAARAARLRARRAGELGAGASPWLRVNGLRGEQAEPALRAMLERLYEDATSFGFPEERFERVYGEVEVTLYRDAVRARVVAPLRGVDRGRAGRAGRRARRSCAGDR